MGLKEKRTVVVDSRVGLGNLEIHGRVAPPLAGTIEFLIALFLENMSNAPPGSLGVTTSSLHC